MSLSRAREARRRFKESVEEKKEWVAYYKDRGLNDVEAQKAASREMQKQAFVSGAKGFLHKADEHLHNYANNGGTAGGAMGGMLGGGLGGSMLGGSFQQPRGKEKKRRGDGGIFGSMGY